MPEQPKLAAVEPSSSGGSAAGQAFRAELARQGMSVNTVVAKTPSAEPPEAPSRKPANEARAVERKRVNGRARVLHNATPGLAGKTVDISETGACILLDHTLASKTACVLEFDIFHDGKRYVFSTPAQAVYGVFSSGKGFKVGFQFGPRSPEASRCIAALVA